MNSMVPVNTTDSLAAQTYWEWFGPDRGPQCSYKTLDRLLEDSRAFFTGIQGSLRSTNGNSQKLQECLDGLLYQMECWDDSYGIDREDPGRNDHDADHPSLDSSSSEKDASRVRWELCHKHLLSKVKTAISIKLAEPCDLKDSDEEKSVFLAVPFFFEEGHRVHFPLAWVFPNSVGCEGRVSRLAVEVLPNGYAPGSGCQIAVHPVREYELALRRQWSKTDESKAPDFLASLDNVLKAATVSLPGKGDGKTILIIPPPDSPVFTGNSAEGALSVACHRALLGLHNEERLVVIAQLKRGQWDAGAELLEPQFTQVSQEPFKLEGGGKSLPLLDLKVMAIVKHNEGWDELHPQFIDTIVVDPDQVEAVQTSLDQLKMGGFNTQGIRVVGSDQNPPAIL